MNTELSNEEKKVIELFRDSVDSGRHMYNECFVTPMKNGLEISVFEDKSKDVVIPWSEAEDWIFEVDTWSQLDKRIVLIEKFAKRLRKRFYKDQQ